jgi:hypothetical protein
MGMFMKGDSLGVGDTINFDRVKFDEKLYHWGGGWMAGIEFKPDSQFHQYINVLCSDESDVEIGYGEDRYFFTGDSTVEVRLSLRDFQFKILYVDSKKLSIRIVKQKTIY